ncbi:MAG: glycosyltransferase [Clostridia bacterium]
MTIDIICPLYNAEKYIEKQLKQIEEQSFYKYIKNIRYIITKGQDKTTDIAKKLQKENEKILYKEIEINEFSHSLTREKEAFESNADIIVFITQDVIIERKNWLENLTNPIKNNEVVATYSRQLCNDKKTIEFYTRQKNYPDFSIIKSQKDICNTGINTFFYSDASSAIKNDIFKKMNGYDKKNLPTNEDMYIAYKIINNGYKIKYCADSEVIHSHNFSLKETFNRYKAYGKFLKQEPQINVKSTKAGGGLAKYILKQSLKDKNFIILFKFLPNMAARYIGMKVGMK